MGLDMYFHASKYVSRRMDEKEYDELSKAIHGNLSHAPIPVHAGLGGMTVDIVVMYWGKANAIHHWFVSNLAEGVDDCQRISVTIDDMVELRDLCTEVVALFPAGFGEGDEVSEEVAAAAAEKLSPVDGFFFGSTNIDYWYYRDVVETRDSLTRIIDWDRAEALVRNSEYSGWEYFYQASW